MKILRTLMACILFTAGPVALVFADENDLQGQIHRVDLKQRVIVINDWVYNLALTLKVHEGEKLTTDFALREYANVKFKIDPKSMGDNVQLITDIWIMGNNE